MRKVLPFLIITLVAIGVVTCKKFVEPKKYESSNIPQVVIVDLSDITSSSAKISCEVMNGGGVTVNDRGICWSTEPNPTMEDNHISSGYGMGPYICDLTDLEHGPKYYVKAYAVNSYGTGYSEDVELNLMPFLATVTTNEVTHITYFSAECGGNITDDGGGTILARGICWNTEGNLPNINDPHTNDGTGTGLFSSLMTDLLPNKKYYVRAYATNEAGTNYGDVLSFNTSNASFLPVVVTGDVTDITSNSATCFGDVTSDNGYAITERGICYGTTTNITIANNHITAPGELGTFSCHITGLSSGVIYYYRAYAKNITGTSYGLIYVFPTN